MNEISTSDYTTELDRENPDSATYNGVDSYGAKIGLNWVLAEQRA